MSTTALIASCTRTTACEYMHGATGEQRGRDSEGGRGGGVAVAHYIRTFSDFGKAQATTVNVQWRSGSRVQLGCTSGAATRQDGVGGRSRVSVACRSRVSLLRKGALDENTRSRLNNHYSLHAICATAGNQRLPPLVLGLGNGMWNIYLVNCSRPSTPISAEKPASEYLPSTLRVRVLCIPIKITSRGKFHARFRFF